MKRELKLFEDVLDQQIVGRDDLLMGKVDGVLIEVRDGEPPRVVAIEIGAAVAFARLGPRWGRIATAISKRLGIRKSPAYRIDWDRVTKIDINLHVDIEGAQSPALAWERWLRQHVINRIPFGR